jgi:hypothetical protein
MGSRRRHSRTTRGIEVLAIALLLGGLIAVPVGKAAAAVTPTIAIGDATVVEGDAGARTLHFAVTLSQPGTSTVSVGATITAGSATAGKTTNPDADFYDKAGATKPLTFTFSRGKTPVVKYVVVSVYADTALENDETVHVTLSAPSPGWALGRTEATGTIVDDDATAKSGIEISAGDATVHEGDATKRAAKLAVTLSVAPTIGEVRVDYTIADGTAVCGPMRAGLPVVTTDDCFDNAGRTKTLVFKVGQRRKVVPMFAFPDTRSEPDESFAVQLSNPIGATLRDDTGTVGIIDDDTPTITAPDAPVLVSAVAGPANGMLVVSWDPPTSDGGSPVTDYELEITRPADTIVGSYTGTGANVVCGSPGITCGLRVRARNVVGASAWSDPIDGTTWRAPDAVGDLSASGGIHTVHAIWSTPISPGDFPIIDYRIERSDDGTNFAFVEYTTARASSVSCGAERSTCWVRVFARNAAGLSAEAVSSATSWGRPGAPTLASIRRIGISVGLGWTPPADDGGTAIFDYTGERTIDGGATWTSVGSVQSSLPTCPSGISCGFRVAAVNIVGASSPSNVLTVGP